MHKLAPLFSAASLVTLLACGSSSNEVPAPDSPPSGDAASGDAASGKSYDPCAGKKAGDPCNICPPTDTNCMETMQLKVCNAEGQCTSQMGEVQ